MASKINGRIPVGTFGQDYHLTNLIAKGGFGSSPSWLSSTRLQPLSVTALPCGKGGLPRGHTIYLRLMNTAWVPHVLFFGEEFGYYFLVLDDPSSGRYGFCDETGTNDRGSCTCYGFTHMESYITI